ncbi:hypothetical protein ABZU76_38560 [Amycolatopsis sp. NPDC005232]|uniref:hypothetical protein n=1 Tax=Amycolatopsis sp. NPDC005232 TaxID=3157027 RepID=UPI0033B56F86
MTDISPSELPEVRAEIIDWINGPTAAQLWFKHTTLGSYDWLPFQASTDPATYQSILRGTEITRLREAELFYVAAEMVELVEVAAHSIPDFQLAPQDLPAPAGFMLFERPIAAMPAGDTELGISAVSWAPMPGREHMLLASTYLDRAEAAPFFDRAAPNRQVGNNEPKLVYAHGGEFGWAFGDNEGHAPEATHFMATLAPRLKAAWLLMQQPVTDLSNVSVPRPARRRLQRAGHEPSPVRLIQLRRPPSPRDAESSAAAQEYRHRWIVRGHWRQQWYPSRQVHRPVWIEPHVKGPSDAPLLSGDKVHVWKR